MTDQPETPSPRREALGSRAASIEKSCAGVDRNFSAFGFRFSFGFRVSDLGFKQLATLSLLSLLLLPASAQTSSRTNTPAPRAARPDFAAFKLITDRNIFSPTRIASRPMRYETRTTTQPTARRGDYFALVGTMEYAKGAFAFFDGTSSEYRKTLKPRDSIAGYQLGDITQNHVSLARDTNTIELKVGMQMRHNEDGSWIAVTPAETPVGSSPYVSATTTRPSPAVPSLTTVGTNGLPGLSGGEGPPIIMMSEEGAAVVVPAGEAGATPGAAPGATTGTTPTPAPAPAAAGGGEDEVLRRLMQRREQEMNR